MGFRTDIARHVWATRYRRDDERDVDDTWQRVAQALLDAIGWQAEGGGG